MDPKRKGEIAYALLKHRASKEGVTLNREEFRRSVGNLAKATGINEAELTEFTEMLTRELVEETFQKGRVRVIS